MQTVWPNLIGQQQSNTLAMRQLVPIDPGHFDLAWTFFGYADDTPEMRQRRLRQANLMGPASLVSLDDSEAMLLSQAGIEGNDAAECVAEMGGRVRDEPHMVTETAIRGFYQHYRAVMNLREPGDVSETSNVPARSSFQRKRKSRYGWSRGSFPGPPLSRGGGGRRKKQQWVTCLVAPRE